MGDVSDLQLEATLSTGSTDQETDAAAQRHRGVEHHEKNGLAAMPPARSLICRNDPYAFTNGVTCAMSRIKESSSG